MTLAGGATKGAGNPVSCTHCSLPVPAGLVDSTNEEQFCCAGCRAVWDTIHGCGLGRYYELEERLADPAPAAVTDKSYEPYDDPVFLDRYSMPHAEGLLAAELYLEGVRCGACVWLVERLPSVVSGVVEARVDLSRRMIRVVWDPSVVALSRIARRLDDLGYPSHPYRRSTLQEAYRREERSHLVRIGVAGACAGNVMLIAFALYGGMFAGMQPEVERLLRTAGFALTLVALLWPGRVFLKGALSSLRSRVLHMDVPVAIALAIGTVWGAWNTLRGAGEVYFESLTAVIFLLLVGRWVQYRQQRSAQDAVELLSSLTPSSARRIEPSGDVRIVPVEALSRGDQVELLPGESVPADGALVEGETDLDLSLLTGESVPVPARVGDLAYAGTTNVGRRIVIEVRATGLDTRAGRLMAMVDRFARERPPIVRVADRVAHAFVLVVLVAASATAAIWAWLEPARAIENTVALLIVTCPCALGLATPLAIVAAVGRAARAGILIKGGEVIEQLARGGRVLLDKTGTLTAGRMSLELWRGDERVRSLVHAVESRVAHPIARALTQSLEAEEAHAAVEATLVGGAGVLGSVDGRELAIGSVDFVSIHAGDPPPELALAVKECVERGLTPVVVAVDGESKAVAGVGDALAHDAASAVERLGKLGWEPAILSGDHPEVVSRVAGAVGVQRERAWGAVSPEGKARRVSDERTTGETVMMVGDGVNDAAALAAASVGVSVHGGAEASLAAADVYLSREGLGPVVDLVVGSRRAVRVIYRNVALSAAYNLVAGGLAMVGLINPLIAAVLMPLSSLTVVTLSYRSRTFES